MPQSIIGLLTQKISWGSRAKVADPAAVPYSIDFSSLPSPQNIDLSTTQFKNTIGDVRTLYIDNSDNNATVTVLNAVTRQEMEIPAGYQAYMPVVSSTPQFQISTAGAAIVGFDFLNVQIPPFMWNAEPSTTVIGSILFAGSAGTDHSVNAPAFPPIGLTLLADVPANTSRALIGVQYQDANQCRIFLVNAGGTRTRILLESGGGAGVGGGAWTSQTFKGELLVYATAGDQVAVYEQ